jgi:hypothetical protein
MYNKLTTHPEGYRPNLIQLELVSNKSSSNQKFSNSKTQKTLNNINVFKKIHACINQNLLPAEKFYNLAGRLYTCHDEILISSNPNETDKGKYIARTTCKNALVCPHCASVLSRKRSIAFSQVVDKIKSEDEQNGKRKFVFFTLTSPDIHISNLSDVYEAMSFARSALMQRLRQKRSKFKLGTDFISKFEFNYTAKNTEYIADSGKKMIKKAGHVNPHFHVLMWAPLDFNNSDLENFESELSEIWYSLLNKYMIIDNEYANAHHKLITDVRLFANSLSEDFTKQVFELTKYLAKHTDIYSMHSQHFAAFMLAMTGKRLFSAGGVFKNLKMMQVDDNDELNSGDTENNSDDTENNSFFVFDKERQIYQSVAVATELIALIRKLRSFRFSIINYSTDGYVRTFYSLRIENANAVLYESRSQFSRSAPNFTRLTLDAQSPEWAILNSLIATNQLEFIPRPADL